MNSIPFWFEDHVKVMNVTNGEIIENVYDRYSQGEVDKARAWWNTNLTMEDYTPVFMPFFQEDAHDLSPAYELLAARIVQRNTTKQTPTLPTITLQHGVVEYNEQGQLERIFVTLPHHNKDCENRISVLEFDHNMEYFCEELHVSGAPAVEGQVYEKLKGCRYWNGFQYL